jgi:hypothetical protein
MRRERDDRTRPAGQPGTFRAASPVTLASRRTRRAAALVALLSLTFSFSEGVWASTCLPGMRMDDSEMMSGTVGPESVATTPAGMAEERTPRGKDTHRSCPFTSALAAQACAGVSSMPARSTESATPVTEGPDIGSAVAAPRGLLLDVALFRPPRA